MKKIAFLFVGIIYCIEALSAQSSWQSINSAGGSSALIQGKQIHFSIGQAVSSGTSNPSKQIQGYQYIYFNSKTATNETRHSAFRFYPNPASDIIHILNEDIQQGRLEIYNMSGQRIMIRDVHANEILVDVSSLSPGSYIFSMIYDQSLFKQIIVIQ